MSGEKKGWFGEARRRLAPTPAGKAQAATARACSDPVADEIRRQQQIHLVQRMPIIAAVNLIGSVMTATVFWNEVPRQWTVAVWLAVMLILGLFQLVTALKLLRRPTPERVSGSMLHRGNLMSGIIGLLWGMIAIVFEVPGSTPHDIFTALIMGGVASGTVSVLTPLPSATIPFMAGAIGPMFAKFLFIGTPIHLATAIFAFIYFVALSLAALRARATLVGFVRAQREREDARGALEDAIESTNNGFALFDAEHNVVIANSRFRRWFPDAQAVLAEHADERPRKLANGRWVISNQRPTRGGGVVSIHPDVTELIDREEELVAAKLRAEAADRAKSQFLANMSHEIRTPMNGVLGLAAALEDSPLDSRQGEMVTAIREAGDSLMMILNDILDLSKIEAGAVELEATPFRMHEVVRGVEAIQGPKARDKGVRFTVTIDESAAGRRVGDPHRLKQILQNLVSNAVKFTAEGKVDLRVCADTDEPDALLIEVEDTGIGMTADQRERIFNDFAQADASTTRKFGGTGLGLAIVKRLVAALDGEIDVESAPGRGSTFRVRVRAPRDESPEKAAPAADPERPAASGPIAARVLAVDDNPTNRMVIGALLQASGVELAFAENGREAVDACREKTFDLVFMDIQMPELDGVAATREIRAREQSEGTAPTPIVALTANVMDHQRKEYIAAGMDGVVGKPIRKDELVEVVRRFAPQAEDALRDAS